MWFNIKCILLTGSLLIMGMVALMVCTPHPLIGSELFASVVVSSYIGAASATVACFIMSITHGK
jgi:hypothetical protein